MRNFDTNAFENDREAIKKSWWDRQPTPRSLRDLEDIRFLWRQSAEYRECLALMEEEMGAEEARP